MAKYIKNTDTGVLFPYTEVLAEEVRKGFIGNLAIVEIPDEKPVVDTEDKTTKKGVTK
jgi:hypothetical protein